MQRDDQTPRSRRSDRLERANALVQTLAILGAGAWAVYTFIYEARIKPALEPPAVSVTTSLVRAGERDRHVAIRSTVTRRNVGQTGVRVLGLVYNVTGVRVRFGETAGAALSAIGPAPDRTTTARADTTASSCARTRPNRPRSPCSSRVATGTT